MINAENVEKTGFGFSPDNPIKTMFIPLAYAYLNNLKHKMGHLVKYERMGSHKFADNPHLLDKYKLYVVIKDEKTEEVTFKVYMLWIDSYSSENSKEAPEDFEFIIKPNW